MAHCCHAAICANSDVPTFLMALDVCATLWAHSLGWALHPSNAFIAIIVIFPSLLINVTTHDRIRCSPSLNFVAMFND